MVIKLHHGNQKGCLIRILNLLLNTKLQVKIDGSCFLKKKKTFTNKNMANIYIVYEIIHGQISNVQILHCEIFCLELLSYINMLILININILARALDLMHMAFSH